MKKILVKKGTALAMMLVAGYAFMGCSHSSDSSEDTVAENPGNTDDGSGNSGNDVIDADGTDGSKSEVTPEDNPSSGIGSGGGSSSSEGIKGTTGGSIKSNAGVSIIKAQGWLESGYVTWSDTAESYNVYYKASDATDWTQADSPLIRNYGDYARVDILGLKAGDYDVKIHAVNDGTESTEYSEASVSVASHDRAGYAFTGTTTPGAYKADGTLKDNAVVIYLTNENKESVSMDVVVGNKNKTETKTGIIEILLGYKKGYETRPLAIRVVGNVTGWSALTSTDATKGDLVIENGNKTVGITLEGVGDDAVANEWGLRFKNANYCEARNLGFLNCSSDEGDNIGLQQDNNYIWVHNCDYFYGNAGSDKDQVKGDGALDCKKSNYVTFSYNHFWDNGKCNLLGLSEGTKSYESGAYYITYHHNWYDHSDSRHPRTRYYNAHVYNNYYDGNAKYGAGATLGSSIFLEANYFRSCQYPALISMQGSDVLAGSETADYVNNPTFSKEGGGIIKAYNNYMTGNCTFIPYNASSYLLKGTEVSVGSIDTTKNFDAVVVSDRNQTVSSDIKANVGVTVSLKNDEAGVNYYSNFDTASGFYAYSADEPAAAMENVKKYAGRVDGGDFKYTFDNSVEDTNYSVINELKSAVTNYTTKLTKVYGDKWVYGSSSSGSETPSSGETPAAETEAVAVTGVSLSKTELTLTVGKNETITATIEPTNATTQDVTWATSDKAVATVSKGKITAVAAGKATITVTTKDGSKTATCEVTVEAAPADDLSGLEALAAGTYNLTTKKITVDETDIAAVFSSQSAGDSQTKSGILITAKIDSAGANLKKDAGKIYIKIDSDKTVSFKDSTAKGLVKVYAVSEDGTISETETAGTASAGSYSYALSAGTYAIVGTNSSSAKIASITVEAAE